MVKPKFSEVYEINIVFDKPSSRPPFFGWGKTEQVNSLQEVIGKISPYFRPPEYEIRGWSFLKTTVSKGETILTFESMPGRQPELPNHYEIRRFVHIRIRYKLLLEVS